ncbi:MAG: hypothetical protein IIY32_08020, partial [Thermoguttaceae bacterium]|nr:hypothetical protein [Thermoguttaceae bacterium]
MAQGDVDVLWVGDSITHRWEKAGQKVWENYYGSRKAMNFGIGGDRTSQVLWRLENSPMDKISPKLSIVMIGTNNLGHKKPNSQERFSSPQETVEGIQAIVNKLKDLYPETKILLLEVFPRGAQPDDPLRLLVNETNEGLRKIYANGAIDRVTLYSLNDLFLTKDGVLEPDVMPDYLHPSEKGYEIWAKAIEPLIADALNESPEECQPAAVDVEWWTERFK